MPLESMAASSGSAKPISVAANLAGIATQSHFHESLSPCDRNNSWPLVAKRSVRRTVGLVEAREAQRFREKLGDVWVPDKP
jgi:hypothetical protein